MITDEMAALIVAKPGRMRDGLHTLLRTIPGLTTIKMADDSPSALNIVSTDKPTLVLLGASLDEQEIRTLLEQSKRAKPGTQCIVLVDNISQQAIARAGGADSVLLMGFSAHQFFAAIDELLALDDITGSNRPKI